MCMSVNFSTCVRKLVNVGTCRGQRTLPDPVELELQVVAEPITSRRITSVLNH